MSATIRQATSILPTRSETLAPEDDMEYEAVETVVCRLDKNAHCLYRRSLRLHHLRIFQQYISDDQTFEVLPWSGSKAARFLRSMYYVWYPFRFKRPNKIVEADLPRAIVRPKNACHDETGMCCQKPGHTHERIIVSTVGLPQHAQGRQFSRGVQVMMQNTGLPDCELWALRDLREKRRESRGQLRMLPHWWNTCMRCRQEKPAGGKLGRFDCSSHYTKSNMTHLIEEEVPELRRRYETHTRRRTVTADQGKQATGRPGGNIWGSFRRRTYATQECVDWLQYECRCNILTVGSGRKLVVLRQKRGCAMGGRGSKVKTSVLFGLGEGRLLTDPDRLQQLGFWHPDIPISDLLSVIRLVDDAICASLVFCVQCMKQFVEAQEKDGSPSPCRKTSFIFFEGILRSPLR